MKRFKIIGTIDGHKFVRVFSLKDITLTNLRNQLYHALENQMIFRVYEGSNLGGMVVINFAKVAFASLDVYEAGASEIYD